MVDLREHFTAFYLDKAPIEELERALKARQGYAKKRMEINEALAAHIFKRRASMLLIVDSVIVAITETENWYQVVASKSAVVKAGEIYATTKEPRPATAEELEAFGLKG